MSVAAVASELDRFAPAYEFSERHALRVRATPERIRAAILAVTPDEIFLFRALTWLRRFGRPLPESIRSLPPGTPLHDIGRRTTFVTLADTARELVSATVVTRPRGAARPAGADELLALRSRPGYAIATMNFAIRPLSDGSCVLSTETRVHATGVGTRVRFAAYWLLIRAGSGFIRRMWLRAIKRRAEASAPAAVVARVD